MATSGARCKCNELMEVKVAKTAANFGRPYLTCNKCNYFRFVDNAVPNSAPAPLPKPAPISPPLASITPAEATQVLRNLASAISCLANFVENEPVDES